MARGGYDVGKTDREKNRGKEKRSKSEVKIFLTQCRAKLGAESALVGLKMETACTAVVSSFLDFWFMPSPPASKPVHRC